MKIKSKLTLMLLLFLLFLKQVSIFSQSTYPCNGYPYYLTSFTNSLQLKDGYLSNIQAPPLSSLTVIQNSTNIYPNNNNKLNGIGYNIIDGYIYGSIQGTDTIVKLTNNSSLMQKFDVNNTAIKFSPSGDVSKFGIYYNLLLKNGNLEINSVDLNTGPPYSGTISAITNYTGSTVADVVLHPMNGLVYFWSGNQFYSADLATLTYTPIGQPYPTNLSIGGAALLDVNHILFYYNNVSYYVIDINTGIIQSSINANINTLNFDLCSCLTINLFQDVVRDSICANSNDTYSFTIANDHYHYSTMDNVCFSDTLDDLLSFTQNTTSILNSLQSIYGSSVTVSLSNYGAGANNLIQICGLSVPTGTTTFSLSISVGTISANTTINNQAWLFNLPTVIGLPHKSDNIVTTQLSDKTPLTVIALPHVNLTSNRDTICAGETITLTPSGGVSYTLNPLNGIMSGSLALSPNANTSYTLTGSNSFGCLNNKELNVIIDTIRAHAGPNGQLDCVNSTNVLAGSGTGQYTWLGPNSGIQSGANTPNPIVMVSGIYTLVLSNSRGCSNQDTVEITKNIAAPLVSLNVSGNLNCHTDTVTLTDTIALAGYTYIWSSNIIGAVNQPTALANASGNYTLTVTDPTNGCSTIKVAQVIAIPMFTVNASMLASVKCYNSNEGVLEVNLVGGGFPPFTVKNQNNNYVFSGTTTFPVNFLNLSAANYSVLVTDAIGCTQMVYQDILQPAQLKILTNNVNICEGQSTIITPTITGGVGTYVYQWLPLQFNSIDLAITPYSSETHTLTVTDTNQCSVSSLVKVQVYSKPHADFIFSPTNPTVTEPIASFTNTSVNATRYNWFYENNLFSNQKNPDYTFPGEGNYMIKLISFNDHCSDTVRKIVVVEDEFLFYAPNAFTPNEDKLNEAWYPILSGYKENTYSVMVFDRWGEKLYESQDPRSDGWNGKHKNEFCKEDIYVWKAMVEDKKGKTHNFKGHITLYK